MGMSFRAARQCRLLEMTLKPARPLQKLTASHCNGFFSQSAPLNLYLFATHSSTLSSSSPTPWRYKLLYTAAGGVTCAVCAWFGFQFMHTTTAVCQSTITTTGSVATSMGSADNGGTHKESSFVPSLMLYQYQTCPFCCKTRAFLDYYGISYKVVEVNPLFRREIKFSKYRKVPFILCDDIQVNDSSLLISVLKTCMVNEGDLSVSQVVDLYPEMTYTDGKGKTHTERANKYFIMLGEDGDAKGISLAERREEREWREWVDNKLVHVLPPNIYRTPSEALQASNYISSVGKFNVFERITAKYVGAFGMYFIAKMLKKKYKLDDDVRRSLYRYCKQWCAAVGKDRMFMGGKQPNLADLAVYGVLSSIEGYDSFSDMLKNTSIGPWYFATQKLVQQHKTTLPSSNSSRDHQ